MAQYKLTYFDFSGSRGEECRLAMSVAGVEFEDHRIQQAEWPALKAASPYGSVPILEVAGKPPLAQSNAILIHLGQAHGLLPKDAWEVARHIAILESVEQLRGELEPSSQLSEPSQKKQAREEFANGPLKEWASSIERQVQGPFVAGADISVADIKLYQIMSSFKKGVLDHIPTDVFKAFPKLDGVHVAVGAHPRVVAWQSRR